MKQNARQKAILIVEDETAELNILSEKFIEEGFKVLKAENGEEGLRVALSLRPDLILLDIIMPVMDGITMLKKLRKENDWGKKVPVIILTNLVSDDEQKLRDITKAEPAFYLIKSNWKLEDVVVKVKGRLGIA